MVLKWIAAFIVLHIARDVPERSEQWIAALFPFCRVLPNPDLKKTPLNF